jgi:hypothetical protein
MAEFAELLKAIAAVLSAVAWPIVVAVLVWIFRDPIKQLISDVRQLIENRRVKKATLLGQSIELELNELAAVTQNIEIAPIAGGAPPSPSTPPPTEPPPAQPAPPPPPEPDAPAGQGTVIGDHPGAPSTAPSRTAASDDITPEILIGASKSPKLALMQLAAVLERDLRDYIESVGPADARRTTNVFRVATELMRNEPSVPSALPDSLRSFYNIRNHVVHGYFEKADDNDAIRAIDVGLRILAVVRELTQERRASPSPSAVTPRTSS